MLSINTEGLVAKLKQLENIQKQKITVRVQHAVTEMFLDLLEHTPQWSGNLVANWRVEVGSSWQGSSHYMQYGEVFQTQGRNYANAYKAGDAPAMLEAWNEAQEAISRIKWNSLVTIVNKTPYLDEVEHGQGPNGKEIRPVNKFSYGNTHGIAMVGYIKMKYGRLGYL